MTRRARKPADDAGEDRTDDGVRPSDGDFGAKEQVAEDRRNSDLKNSDLSDDERRALFLNGIVKIERELKKKAEVVNPIDAAIKLTRKQMKAEGFDKTRVDDALRRRKMEPEEVAAEFKAMVETSKWLGLPIGYEPDLFEISKDRTPLVERAYADGKIAGMGGEDGRVPEPKYSPGSDAGQAWLRGWNDGQAVLLSAISKRAPVESEAEGGDEFEGADDTAFA